MSKANREFSKLSLTEATRFAKYDNLDAAIEYCDKAIEHDPNNVPAYQMKAKYLLGQGKTEAALKVYQEAMESDNISLGTLSAFHNNLGVIYHSIGDCTKALEQYQDALSLNQDAIKVKINMALTYVKLKDFVQAKEIYLEVMSEHDLEEKGDSVLKATSELHECIEFLQKDLVLQLGQTSCAEEVGKLLGGVEEHFAKEIEC